MLAFLCIKNLIITVICILCVDLICGLNDKFKRRDTQHPLVINPNCLRPTVGGGGGGGGGPVQ